MGFSIERAKEMLEKHNGNIEMAIEELTSNLGRQDDEPIASTKNSYLLSLLIIRFSHF